MCQGKCLGSYTSALLATLDVQSGNNKIIYQYILTDFADVTNDLSMPCHEQRTGTKIATSPSPTIRTHTQNQLPSPLFVYAKYRWDHTSRMVRVHRPWHM